MDSAEREGLRPKGNVPNLRFPEFQGEWEKCKLGNIANITGGYAFKSDTLNSIGGKYQVVKMGNLYQNQLDLHRSPSYTNILTSKAENVILRKGDIAITLTGTNNKRDFGYTYIFNDEKNLLLNQRCGLIRTKGDPYFLSCLLKTYAFLNQFFESATGGTGNQANVSTKAMEMFSVNTPSLKEQKKIGELMALLDERIATQNKIIDKLQSLIKGIMVELQKQGVDKGTWKKVFLSDVLTERNERNTNLFQVFSVSVSQGVVNQVDYLGRSFAAKDTSKYNVVHYGDLVYTKSPTGSFPYGIVKQSFSLENVAVSPLYGVYKPKSLAVGAYLHEYFMSEINTHNYLHPLIQKGAKNTINITNQRFLENCVLLPTNINELLQISKLLRSLNNKIKYQQDILQQYQKQKQYLLRQMFI